MVVAVIIELLGNRGNPIRYTVADGAGIPKGTVCKITTPRLAAASGANTDPFAGIAAAEKVKDDGSTTLALYTCGIFDIHDGGEDPTAGIRLRIGGANSVRGASSASQLYNSVGLSLNYAGDRAGLVATLIGSGL